MDTKKLKAVIIAGEPNEYVQLRLGLGACYQTFTLIVYDIASSARLYVRNVNHIKHMRKLNTHIAGIAPTALYTVITLFHGIGACRAVP